MPEITPQQKASLRSFILKLISDKSRTLTDSESLVQSGLVDSIQIAQIIIFLESEFSLRVKDEDLNLESFDSLTRIAALIENSGA